MRRSSSRCARPGTRSARSGRARGRRTRARRTGSRTAASLRARSRRTRWRTPTRTPAGPLAETGGTLLLDCAITEKLHDLRTLEPIRKRDLDRDLATVPSIAIARRRSLATALGRGTRVREGRQRLLTPITSLGTLRAQSRRVSAFRSRATFSPRSLEVVMGTDNSGGANTGPDAASSRRPRNRRGTTAGHISSRRSPNSSTPFSTCAFAAPGVGLEPTTYGLTVRGVGSSPAWAWEQAEFQHHAQHVAGPSPVFFPQSPAIASIVSPCHERAVRADHPRLVPDPGWPPLEVARITARVSAALRSPPGTEWA